MPARSKELVALFGRCGRGHRAPLARYEDRKLSHQETYVEILLAVHHHVYRVRCPTCGEEYMTSDSRVERVKD